MGGADDLAGGDIERREEGGSSVPAIVVSAQLGQPRTHGQDGLGPVQGLDLALLVGAENDRPVRRIEIQPNDVAHLLHQLRVGGQLEGVSTVWLEPEGAPDPKYGGVAEADCLGHAPGGPVGGVAWRRLQSPHYHLFDFRIADPSRRTASRLIQQSGWATSHEPSPPSAHGGVGDTELLRDRDVAHTSRTTQHDARTQRQCLGRSSPPRPAFQGFAIFGAENKRCLGTATGALHAGALRIPGSNSTILAATSEAGH